MKDEMVLRCASIDDADRLFQWRSDPVTRRASRDDRPIDRETHYIWLNDAIADSKRGLWVAEVNGKAVGTCRADIEEGVSVISWTIAPDSRGQGFGKRMVQQLLSQLEGCIRAEIRGGNEASKRVAEAAGLTMVGEKDGFKHYARSES